MPGDIDIATVAAVLADTTRANMLLALSDGRSLPAGELAWRARVKASTASSHLAKLVDSGLLVVVKQGRHRYFRLADASIMQAIETLASFAPSTPVSSLRESAMGEAIRSARMCYNHLAGRLGVSLSEALVEKHILDSFDEGYIITDDGKRWMRDFGIDDADFKKQKSLLVPCHIDWSERRHHIAGALGAALSRRLLDLAWIERLPSSRAVRLTEVGRLGLKGEFHLDFQKDREVETTRN